MRKLKLQVQMTIDGFMAGPEGEMDWMTWDWDNELKRYVGAITDPVDCIVLGRKLAEGFIPHWASIPDEEGAYKMNHTPKVVFTHTMQESIWDNTSLATGELAAEINKLKAQEGNDIIVYGGATFVSSLIGHNLVDDLYLFINPVAIGKGMPVFQLPDGRKDMVLVESKAFDCGIVVLHYTPKEN